MICKNCGTNCADGMKFCVICGTPFTADNDIVSVAPVEEVKLTDINSNDFYQNPVSVNTSTVEPETNTTETVENNTSDTYFSGFGMDNNFNSNPAPAPKPAYSNYESNVVHMNEINESMLPEHLRPLSPWAYLGYALLFGAVPCAGIIMAFIFAFSSDGNVNRRNYARYFLLTLLIGIIISIIYVVIVVAVLGSTFAGFGNYGGGLVY